jgi:hypothetical protein
LTRSDGWLQTPINFGQWPPRYLASEESLAQMGSVVHHLLFFIIFATLLLSDDMDLSSTEALAGQIDRLLMLSSKIIAQRIATLTRDMMSLSVAIMTLLARSEDISRVRILSQDAELAELAITCTALMESLALKLKSCERDADWYMFLTLHLRENELMRDVLRRRNL